MNVDTIPVRSFLAKAVPQWRTYRRGAFLTYTHASEQWHVVVGLSGEAVGTVRVTRTYDGRVGESHELEWPEPVDVAELLRQRRVPDVVLPEAVAS